MSQLATALARLIVRRPLWVALAGLLLTAAAVWTLAAKTTFDSDILSLLPSENRAVQGLKIYNSEFTQTRELAFLLTWDLPPADGAALETFLSLLKKQPWVDRLLDAPPLESQSGRTTTHEVVVPLLFNLPPGEFAAQLDKLQPAAIADRIARLAAQTAAGSPRARIELENDPLGVAAPAIRPVWETISLSDTFDLSTPDGTAVIVPVITTQTDLSAEASRELMARVREFLVQARQAMGPASPAIGVTGRSAYVEEISASMERDITFTSSLSLAVVIGIFWLGFRRLFPLLGIGLILALTALVTTAGGALIFNHLNLIAISFCSILFGLGDDFSLLLCQRYYQDRANGLNRESAVASALTHCAPGIFWVALTTGVGFLALCFSGSAGFAQLGTLVAVGVLLCAILMCLLVFLFVRQAPAQAAAMAPARRFAEISVHQSGRLIRTAAVLFGLALLVALLPWRPLAFDLSPASLEPRNTPAAQTLAAMMAKFPATFEPVMIVLPQPDAAQTRILDETLRRLQAEGLIESFSSPSGLFLDPARQTANRTAVQGTDFTGAKDALRLAADKAGIAPEALASSFEILNRLEAGQEASWTNSLSPQSTWWFLLDRMVSPTSGALISYAKTSKAITIDERNRITSQVESAVPEALVTGWSQALVGLIPWAQRELIVFGGLVAVVVLAILAAVYRHTRFWLLHTLSLAAALAATAATLKLINLPINLLNVLAFPLMLGVGVDYGTHLILAARESGNTIENLAGVIKPVTLSGLTTATGFGALLLAQNPALSGLGAICAIGVFWCVVSSLFIVVPGAAWAARAKG